MDPLTSAALGLALQAGSSALAGTLQSDNKNTQRQKQKDRLVDMLMEGLEGRGEFSGLFDSNFEDFQKGFVDPAKSLFKNQIAPDIQQSFIQSGQQRGTALDDALARAGVDLDQRINENFLQFQQQGENRKTGAINTILGSGEGSQDPFSTGEKASAGFAGYLSSDEFGSSLDNFLKLLNEKPADTQGKTNREGFAL